MEYPEEFKDIAEFIRKNDDFLIVSHFNPDGDAICSTLGFGELLKTLGKKYLMAIEGGSPQKYDFLPAAKRIFDPSAEELPLTYSTLVTLDIGSFERIGSAKEMLKENPIILNIDHHSSNKGFGEVHLVDTKSSSVCEIITHLAQYMNVDIGKDMAAYLYTGIMTDTGRFRFGSTSPSAMSACAFLIECGADPVMISEKIYFDLPKEYIEALGKALYSLEFFADDKLAMMEYHHTVEIPDAEGFIDFAVGIRGVLGAVFIRLIPDDGRFKVSLRARGDFTISDIAESYGGGGHPKAAGFRYRGSLQELKAGLITVLTEKIKTYDSSA